MTDRKLHRKLEHDSGEKDEARAPKRLKTPSKETGAVAAETKRVYTEEGYAEAFLKGLVLSVLPENTEVVSLKEPEAVVQARVAYEKALAAHKNAVHDALGTPLHSPVTVKRSLIPSCERSQKL
jgi:hypothetical protein